MFFCRYEANFLNDDDIIDTLFPPSESEDCVDDEDTDPDFFPGDEIDVQRARRPCTLPVFLREDQDDFLKELSKESSSSDSDHEAPSTSSGLLSAFQAGPSTSLVVPMPKERSTNENGTSVSHRKGNNKRGKDKPQGKTRYNKANPKSGAGPKPKGKKKTDKPPIPWENAWLRKRSFEFQVEALPDNIASLKTHYEFFSYFVTPDVLKAKAEESQAYLIQSNPNATQTITETDTKRFLGVCFLLSLAPPHDIRKG